ncbi:hypothetical protein PORY_001248 [Pneumocystis oryctolagi]|uniref:Uncharacterized protein n=1 Tax=Pneumocystis oryctolagi TaxID=42067 RepID=A0ACB7CDR0_9ASCO|nr:hypothetical protein PORY_001248 [Pneumocystis oryctolagi]
MGISYSKRATKKDFIILELKLQRDKLHRYQKSTEIFAIHTREAAKKSLSQGNKQKALCLLRQKKHYQELLEKACAHIETVENLISTIEFALIEKDIICILKQSSFLLKDIQKQMSPESVSKLMNQIEDNVIHQNEINHILSNTLESKDKEFLDELEELQLYVFPNTPNKRICNKIEKIQEIENTQKCKEQKESSYLLLA